MVSHPPRLMALLSFSFRDHAVTEKTVLGNKKGTNLAVNHW